MGLGNLLNLNRVRKFYDHFRKGMDNRELLKDSKWWYRLFELAIAITEIKEIGHMLQGYKTYIVAALTAALALLHALGYIDDATYKSLLALLAAGGVATVGAKINRVETEIKNKLNVNK